MSENSVDKLIKKIQRLRIKEDRLRAQQSRLLRELADAIDDEIQQEPPPAVSPDEPREEQDNGAPRAFDRQGNIVRVGTRVQILTPVIVPGRATRPDDLVGVVTKITTYRLFVRADTGYSTHRDHHNVVKIE